MTIYIFIQLQFNENIAMLIFECLVQPSMYSSIVKITVIYQLQEF
jgi:hypothetical protein